MNDDKQIRIVSVIPAHLNSIRFPRKILYPFFNLSMIEHVRRRALLCKKISKVLVATCDKKIADEVNKYGGNVIMTSDKHLTGTTRVAEAIEKIDCTHAIIIQGDEPLLLPKQLDLIVNHLIGHPDIDAWNATGPINKSHELNKHSYVKCAVTEHHDILYCFRKSPSYGDINQQKSYIRKILGIIAFRKSVLIKLANLKPTTIEKVEFIEQMRIIENRYNFRSIPFDQSTPSVNEPDDIRVIIETLKKDNQQAALLKKIIN
ncbi:MAG: 3-deoxy-manno-octulosonate cytidylyltransferase [Candidatus Marinimicrobia bacterium]|nr:3-deoxy-manno-octulosonate cytidylyltransferase [Candidatus Neomarinimicrobiota bacterium]|tara:strand:+ start:19235 stop:20017 length:783 start_codon:yes stop_codon:yes gene_type:complete